MTTSPSQTSPSRGLPGQLLLVGVLLLVGTGFLGLAAYRAIWPTSKEPDLAAEANADLERRGFKPLSGSLKELLSDPAYKPIPTQSHPLLGQIAPGFTLRDTDNKLWHLKEEQSGPVVLVFYYGYHCDHCVSQLFALDKDIDKFRELGVRVVAVSGDPPELTRERYKKAKKAFGFPVLSDLGNKAAQAYAVYHPGKGGAPGDLMHGTFVITRKGKVIWANAGDEPFTENRTLLIEVARSEGRLPEGTREK